MQLKETRNALNNFAKYVIKQARTNLTKSKKNSSKKLYNSLDYNVNVAKDSISVVFEMEDYGQFQDQGVSGKKTKYNTPFSYKSKMPPSKSFSEWVVRKGLKGTRDKKGRFIPRKSLQYLIARSVFMFGIKPSMFFTKPFETGFERLPKELQEKFGIDIENAI
tara:strand:+ start:261 stop:749 length:489 start_codon:yes stop_codon:yes gene_type:complete